MKFTLVINCNPESETALHAYGVCKTLIESDHELLGVMLVEHGVHLTQSESAVKWQALASMRNFPIHCCVNSAHAFNVMSQHKPKFEPPFQLSGLGQLTALCANADRVITFGERPEGLAC